MMDKVKELNIIERGNALPRTCALIGDNFE